MDDAVSDALGARTHGPEGLQKMLLVSVAAHVVLLMLAAWAPASFWLRPPAARPATVTVDLGPPTGPHHGGLTSIGVLPVRRADPDLPKTRPVHLPAVKPPDLALPDERPRVMPDAPAVNDSPTGVGLSMNDAGGTGRQLNVGDFCCPEYLGTVVQRIRQNWNSGRGASAVATMTFTIQRDGAITHVRLSRSSGNQMLDFLAERALLAAGQLPPLPDAYPHPSLILDLEFNYQR